MAPHIKALKSLFLSNGWSMDLKIKPFEILDTEIPDEFLIEELYDEEAAARREEDAETDIW